MTPFHRTLALLTSTAASAAVLSLGAAVPAQADILPPADGFYTYNAPGEPASEWKVETVCSQPSGTRAQEDYSDVNIQTLGCVLNISSTPFNRVGKAEDEITFPATRTLFSDGLWVAEPQKLGGKKCPDGSETYLRQKFAFSEVTLTGTRTQIWGAECGDEPGMVKTPFTLTFARPLDQPIERFPMQCDYLVGRPSICS